MSDVLAQLFASGRIIDIVLAVTVIEGVALAIYYRATGKGVAPQDYAANMLAGLCLMIALRLALTGASWMLVALCLSASGVIHLLDLNRRWLRFDRQSKFRQPVRSDLA